MLDPLCGRGTTLNQALMYGYDAAGIDLDGKDFEAYVAFLRTYLKRKRLKHRIEFGPVRRERKVVARRLRVDAGRDPQDAYKAGATQKLDVVNADTVRAPEFFRPATFDVLVADAPYGVQHGSTGPQGLPARAAGAAGRGGAGLGPAAAPAAGRSGSSWNTHVANASDAAAAAGRGRAEPVLDDGPYARLEHRVDQAITRDVLVADPSRLSNPARPSGPEQQPPGSGDWHTCPPRATRSGTRVLQLSWCPGRGFSRISKVSMMSPTLMSL